MNRGVSQYVQTMDNYAGGCQPDRIGGRLLKQRGCDAAAGGADVGASGERAGPADGASTYDCSRTHICAESGGGVNIDIGPRYGGADIYFRASANRRAAERGDI